MQLTLDIPDELVSLLRTAHGEDLSRAALEQLALEGYRTGKLSRYQVQQLLGFDNRWDAQAWLGSKGASLGYTSDDLQADRQTLDRILGPGKT